MAVHKNNASPTPLVVRDTFKFDRDGGMFVNAETRTYDVTTTRMTARAGTSYTYDAAGNLTAAGVTAYGYDALDRLVSVCVGGALVVRYAYDVLGRRIVKRVVGGSYLRMIYSGGQVVAEADSGGNVGLRYTWGLGDDDLVGIHDGANHYSVTHDQLGSIRAITVPLGRIPNGARKTIFILDATAAVNPDKMTHNGSKRSARRAMRTKT